MPDERRCWASASQFGASHSASMADILARVGRIDRSAQATTTLPAIPTSGRVSLEPSISKAVSCLATASRQEATLDDECWLGCAICATGGSFQGRRLVVVGRSAFAGPRLENRLGRRTDSPGGLEFPPGRQPMPRLATDDAGWQAAMAEYHLSGLTQPEVCRLLGLPLYAFRWHYYARRAFDPATALLRDWPRFLPVTLLVDPPSNAGPSADDPGADPRLRDPVRRSLRLRPRDPPSDARRPGGPVPNLSPIDAASDKRQNLDHWRPRNPEKGRTG